MTTRSTLVRAACTALAASALLGGCSADDDSAREGGSREHVWKEQTGTIDRARDVGRQLGESAARQKDAAQ